MTALEAQILDFRAKYDAFVRSAETLRCSLEAKIEVAAPLPPAVRTICTVVCAIYEVSLDALLNHKRGFNHVAAARHAAMSLCREFTQMSDAEIGRCFGGRISSAVIHAVHANQARLDTDKVFAARYRRAHEAANVALAPSDPQQPLPLSV